MKSLAVGRRLIGPGQPCFIIAEAGVNHNADAAMAAALVDAAHEAGADAVKFQTFSAERLATRSAPKAAYQHRATPAGESQFEMLKRLELPLALHGALRQRCLDLGIVFLSTPFDEVSADALHHLGVPLFKLPSGEVTNLPFLRHVAALGKPIILSTGMADLQEVGAAVAAIAGAGAPDLALLHCVSEYPADPASVNLRAMRTMADAFDVPVGYSDHTLGLEVALAAVAMGACVIEKHVTLDRTLPGPDHAASLEPAGLRRLVDGIRTVERAIGDGRKQPTAGERATAAAVRRSLVAACRISAGTILRADLIAVKRPGTGLPPARLPDLIGRRVTVAVEAGDPFELEFLA